MVCGMMLLVGYEDLQSSRRNTLHKCEGRDLIVFQLYRIYSSNIALLYTIKARTVRSIHDDLILVLGQVQ